MKPYKVIFENNVPTSVNVLNTMSKPLIKFKVENDKKFIDWYVVFCDDESQAIEIAGKVISSIWGKELE